MEIGNEISLKIRSAIKAKLVDLGVYVDDELPDYIMVMVANKKSQDQMTEDLNLFLGNNTEKFTSWLHDLLQKLQSITADPPKPPEAAPVTTQETTNTVPARPKETTVVEEDELLIGPEHDDFEEEANREAAATAAIVAKPSRVVTQSIALPPVSKTVEPTSSAVTPRAAQASVRSSSRTVSSTRSSVSHDSSRRRENSPHRDIRTRLGTSHRNVEGSSEPTLERQRVAVRKRRAPESVVGTIVRHEVEEEEYDPRRPLIGRVASTVRVGDRRPTVPPSQQANKSLLLKAMTEARDSIAKATARLTEQVAMEEEVMIVDEPTQRVEERERIRTVDRGNIRNRDPARGWGPRDRLGTRARVEPRGMMRSSGSTQRITRVDPHVQDKKQGSGTVDKPVQLYSRSKREEVLQQFRAGLHSDSEETPEMETEEPAVQPQVAVDNRQVQVSSPVDEHIVEDVEEQRTISLAADKTEYYEEEPIDTLIESGADESDFTDEEGEPRVVQEKHPEPPKERPSSPKFVVTLDGVDPTTITGTTPSGAESDSEMQVDTDSPKTVVRVAPQRITTSTPLSMDFNQSDYNQFMISASEIDEDETTGFPPKRSRMPERCKFWLACRNGNDCPYHHPSVPCKVFPNCKFGDKCLYIHPNCRFDANCTRPNCPYTHATKRPGQIGAATLPVVIQPVNVVAAPTTFQTYSTLPTAPQQPPPAPGQVTCRFFPKCTNMNCKYIHPKPCRYGASCRDKANCTFTHPELPPANKLKWTAPNLQRSISADS